MSVSWGTKYDKLKTNLRLAVNRLRLLQKKKTEMALKSRTEIADFLSTDKEDRARIKVESIIREDFVVEAYELLEMFCELLLARFGLIQQMKELDDGIAEAVSSLLWVAPRISHEVSEFKVINDQLTQKYGKQFAEAARMNQLPEPSRVSPKLIQKLSVSAPSKILVEKYLKEIARAGGVDFTPDPKVMRDDDDEIASAERNLVNFMNEEQIGWSVPRSNDGGSTTGGAPGKWNNNGGGGGGVGMPVHPGDFHSPPPDYAAPRPPPANQSMYPKHNVDLPDPPYNTKQQDNWSEMKIPINPQPGTPHAPPNEHIYEVPPAGQDNFPTFPEPPSDFFPPSKPTQQHPGSKPDGKSDDLDFDDLARRFDELKKKL